MSTDPVVRAAAETYVSQPTNFGEDTDLIRAAEVEAFERFVLLVDLIGTNWDVLGAAQAFAAREAGYGADQQQVRQSIQDAAVAGAYWRQGHPNPDSDRSE